MTHLDHQQRINSYFDSSSSFWTEIYDAKSVRGAIYQQRRDTALRWIDDLALSKDSKVLEVGFGTGLMTIELARRGYKVYAIDSSEAMVRRALRGVIDSGVRDRVKVFQGDVHSLQFENDLFDLVLAVGVIPWLESPERAVRQMARVVRSSGFVLLTSDNRARLNHLLDPRWNHSLGPLRRSLKHLLERTGVRTPESNPIRSHFHRNSYIDGVILRNDLEIVREATLGFGPFSFLGRTLLSEPIGIKLHHRLQRLADRGVAGIQSAGSQYLVLARKPPKSSL